MTALLVLHIATFSLSLIVLPALLLATITHVSLPRAIRYSSLVTTIVGVISGCALLIAAPSGAYCALLFSYVVVFAGLYIKSSSAQPSSSAAPIAIDRS